MSTEPVTPAPAGAEKKLLAGLLGILLGWTGAHKFVLGYTKEGIIMLLVFLFGFVLLGLANQHRLETGADAEAFISRLSGFARLLDQESERIVADAALGVMLPSFLMDKTLTQLRTLRRNALRETELDKPPRAFRELFRELRDLLADTGAAQDTDEDA